MTNHQGVLYFVYGGFNDAVCCDLDCWCTYWIYRLRLFVFSKDEALSIGFGMVLILLVIDCCVYCFLGMMLCFMFIIGALCNDQQLLQRLLVIDWCSVFWLWIDAVWNVFGLNYLLSIGQKRTFECSSSLHSLKEPDSSPTLNSTPCPSAGWIFQELRNPQFQYSPLTLVSFCT